MVLVVGPVPVPAVLVALVLAPTPTPALQTVALAARFVPAEKLVRAVCAAT